MSLFGRYTEVIIGPTPNMEGLAEALENQGQSPIVGRNYNTGKYIQGQWRQGIKIAFQINGESSRKSEESYIEIWNMAPFGNLFGKNSPVVIKSGYFKSFSTIFTGVVQDIIRRVDGSDVITKFLCKQQQKQVLSVYTNRTFSSGTKWSDVVKALISDTIVQVGFIEGSVDSIVEDSTFYATSDQSIYRWIDWIVKNKLFSYDAKGKKIKWKWYLRNGLFFCMPENAAFPSGLKVSAKTGLISVQKSDTQSKSKKKDAWVIKMLLVPIVNKDTIFTVFDRSGLHKFYKTQTYKFTSTGDNHIVEANVKEISADEDTWTDLTQGLPYEFDEEFDEDEAP